MGKHILRKATSAVVIAALSASSASAAKFPSKQNRYMSKPLQVCDQGVFYVGGAPKLTAFGAGPTPGPVTQIVIGSMYVQFQTPMKAKSWPVIMVHGSGYTGACVQGTAGGTEGWADHAVRNGVPTYVVDQSGRARSGFDKSVVHEAEYLMSTNVTAGQDLLPTLGGSTSTAWNSWFGHIIPEPNADVTTGQMVRHGAAGDPLCATEPTHCRTRGSISMEGYGLDSTLASRTGRATPAGLGTIVPDRSGHVNPDFPDNDKYLALEAYKFNVPNTESTLPGSICPSCVPQELNSVSTWTPKALAELVIGLGGAIVATHSQSGIIGHHMARVLKEQGKLHLLKGLITIEGSCSFENSGLKPQDFKNIPYLGFKSDYRPFAAGEQLCLDQVNAIKAIGGKADYIQLDQPGPWQGRYRGPWGPNYVGPFAGVSHMMMIEKKNIEVLDVMLDWTKKNIKAPKTVECDYDDDDDDHGHGHGHH